MQKNWKAFRPFGCGSKPTASHFGVAAPPVLVYFSGGWDVHWGYGILTHSQFEKVAVQIPFSPKQRVLTIFPCRFLKGIYDWVCCGWTKSISRHFETMAETVRLVGIYVGESNQSRVSERWCRIVSKVGLTGQGFTFLTPTTDTQFSFLRAQ